MNKETLTTLIKCVFGGLLIFIFAIILSFIVNSIKSYLISDILLIEGIFLTVIGLFPCIGTGSTGFYFKSDKSSNTQFTITDHSGTTKYERDISSIRNILPMSILKFSIIIGGLLTFFLSYII